MIENGVLVRDFKECTRTGTFCRGVTLRTESSDKKSCVNRWRLVSAKISPELFEALEDYKREHHFATRNATIECLLESALAERASERGAYGPGGRARWDTTQ